MIKPDQQITDVTGGFNYGQILAPNANSEWTKSKVCGIDSNCKIKIVWKLFNDSKMTMFF